MIGEIIFILFTLIISFSIFYTWKINSTSGNIFGVFMILFLTISFSYFQLQDNSWETKETINIVSLDRGQEINGFFLGISSSMAYFAYEEIEDDTYVLRKFTNSMNSPIKLIESNNETPRYEKIMKHVCYKDWIFYDCEFEIRYDKKLYVPKGTVLKEFKG